MSNPTPSPSIPFIYYREYFRVKATAYITEEGAFKEKPENLATPLMEVDVIYRICVATEGGELQIVDFANKPLLDKDKKPGGPVKVDGKDWYVEEGEGTTPTECETVFSPIAPESLKVAAGFMYKIAEQQEDIIPRMEE